MKALLAIMLVPGLALAAAAPPEEGWKFKTMDVIGGRVMDCEEKAVLRRDGVNLTHSIGIPPTWVRLVDLPDRFVVINEKEETVLVSGAIAEMEPVDISHISNAVHFPVQVSMPTDSGIMARTTGEDYGVFYLLRSDITMSWTCRMVPRGPALTSAK